MHKPRYQMSQPLWRRLPDSPHFVRGVFGIAFFLWIILRSVGVLDVWDLLTIMLVLFGLASIYDLGRANPIGWLSVSAGILVQVSQLVDYSGGVQLGIWMAFAIVALGILWQSGTIRTRRIVRLRGWKDSHVDLTADGSTLRARGDVRRGEITCRLCNLVVDLRYADITRPPAILNVTCVAGRLDLVVPTGWRIDRNVRTTFSHGVHEAHLVVENVGFAEKTWVAPMRPVGELYKSWREALGPDPDPGFVNLVVQGSSHLGRIRILHA